MALSTREILLVLRAKDQASRVLSDIGRQFGGLSGEAQQAALHTIAAGTAITGVGLVMASVGKAGIDFFHSMGEASMEYTQQAALTLTQVDQLGVSLDDIKRIGRDVAAAIPAPFEQMQSSLYDIFSSMDVNVTQAQSLLEAFSRGAVAGQTNVQTAGRATIAILNGFKIPVEDVNRVMDVQFETVRKGVLTYEEYASTIGRAIPSAEKAGASVEELSGMMAFLTRNGLSAAMAATSSARAFDLLANPKFAESMHTFGIEVLDSAGNFRPMNEVVGELRARLEGLNEGDRAKVLTDLTKGAGGTIQAMRFLNLAVGENGGMLDELTQQIQNSSGAAGDAYDIMFNQPASQAQLLSNNLEILKTLIGDAVVPAMNSIVKAAIPIVQWFTHLDPKTIKLVVGFLALLSVFVFVLGIMVATAGAIMILSGAATLLGLSLGGLLLTAGLIVLAIIAIAAIAYLLITNWDTVKQVAGEVWGYIYDTIQSVWEKMQDFASWVSSVAIPIWSSLRDAASVAFSGIRSAIGTIIGWFNAFRDTVVRLYSWFATNFGPGIMRIFGAVGSFFKSVGGEVIETVKSLYSRLEWFVSGVETVLGPLADLLQTVLVDSFNLAGDSVSATVDTIELALGILQTVFESAFDIIVTVVSAFIETITDAFNRFAGVFMQIFIFAWDFVSNYVATAINLIRDVINVFLNLIQGDWSGAWDAIKQIFIDAWNGIWEALQIVWSNLSTFFIDLPGAIIGFIGDITTLLWGVGYDILQGLWNGIISIATDFWHYISSIPGSIKDFFVGAYWWLFDVGKAIFRGLWDGMKDVWDDVTGWLGDLNPVNYFNDINLDKGHAAQNLVSTGQMVMRGLHNGMKDEWDNVSEWLSTLNPSEYLNGGIGVGSAATAFLSSGVPQGGVGGNVATQQVEEHIHLELDGKKVAEVIRNHERAIR